MPCGIIMQLTDNPAIKSALKLNLYGKNLKTSKVAMFLVLIKLRLGKTSVEFLVLLIILII